MVDAKNNLSVRCIGCADNERFFSGLIGEKFALQTMERLGFSCVAKRYKTQYGEIDLIVENETQKLIVFVEVKRRKAIYDYENVISKRQWERIYNAAEKFLQDNQAKYSDYNIRYDAFICFTENKTTYHIENIYPKE